MGKYKNQQNIPTIDLTRLDELENITLREIEFSHSFPIPDEDSMEEYIKNYGQKLNLKITVEKSGNENVRVVNVSRNFHEINSTEISHELQIFIEDTLNLIESAFKECEEAVKKKYEEENIIEKVETNLFLEILDDFYKLGFDVEDIRDIIEGSKPDDELTNCLKRLIRKFKRITLLKLTQECLKNQIFDAIYSTTYYYSTVQMPVNILVKREDVDIIERILDDKERYIHLSFGKFRYKVIAQPTYVILQGQKPKYALPVILFNTSTMNALEIIEDALRSYEMEIDAMSIIESSSYIAYNDYKHEIREILKKMKLYCSIIRVEFRKLKSFLRDLRTSKFARSYKIIKREPYDYYDRLFDDMDKRIREFSGMDSYIHTLIERANDIEQYLKEICDKIEKTLHFLTPSEIKSISGQVFGVGGSYTKEEKSL